MSDEDNVVDEHLKEQVSGKTGQKVDSLIPSFLNSHRKFMSKKGTTDVGNKWMSRFLWVTVSFILFKYFSFNLSTVIIGLIILHIIEFGLWSKLGTPEEAMRKVMR